jgi:hypothetical protein
MKSVEGVLLTSNVIHPWRILFWFRACLVKSSGSKKQGSGSGLSDATTSLKGEKPF